MTLAQLLVPTGASLIVALIALNGVLRSNRTTLDIARQEREAARERDYMTWRREELRRIGAEVVVSARTVIDEYGKVASFTHRPADWSAVEPIELASRPIAANVEILRFLSAYEAATKCIELREAVVSKELALAVRSHHAALTQDRVAGLKFDQPSTNRLSAQTELANQLQSVQVAVRHFGYAMEAELLRLNSPTTDIPSIDGRAPNTPQPPNPR